MRLCRLALLLALPVFPPLHAVGADLTLLKPNGSTIKTGAYTIELGDADSAGLSFLGPLKITRSDGRFCNVSDRVAIITMPIALAHDSLLYVTTYSGSEDRLYVVDAQDCQVRWTSGKFTGQARLGGDRLRLNEAGSFHLSEKGLPTR